MIMMTTDFLLYLEQFFTFLIVLIFGQIVTGVIAYQKKTEFHNSVQQSLRAAISGKNVYRTTMFYLVQQYVPIIIWTTILN